MQTHVFRVHKPGGPTAMKWETMDLPEPKRGEALVRHVAVGFNMVDTYMRKGAYPSALPPFGVGVEAAGVIEATGPGVKGLKPGDRVAYGAGAPGSYAERRTLAVSRLIKVPDWIDDETAGVMLSRGRTVEYLFNRTHKLKKGETILFHAAAGGVGLIACQWAKAVGATLIGTVGSDAKARLARKYGAAHVINYAKKDFAAEVTRLTRGEGVDVVYDSVGKATWRGSLDSVKRLGLVVSFGTASGPPPAYDLLAEGFKNSAFITRATTANYMTSEAIERKSARAVMRMMKSGAVTIPIGHRYRLGDAVQVHRDAEARKTTGAVVMIP